VSGNDKPAASRRSTRVSCPPYNPGLHRLVEGKLAGSEPLDPEAQAQGFSGWHQRGYLPHRDAPGLTQFVTFRLRDSLPVSRRAEWAALLRMEDDRKRRKQLEEYLDRGHGECSLRCPGVAALAEASLRHFDGQRFQLLAWAVMPNHVHVLVQIWQMPLATVLHSWKGFIARESNKLLHREGAFWEREYWDTYMRSEEQSAKAVHYTEQNPVKARLANQAKDWPWSSARFRDPYGKLIVQPVGRSAGL
jgi:REP-associated tyrosine transposase